jgi:hypothetical protein
MHIAMPLYPAGWILYTTSGQASARPERGKRFGPILRAVIRSQAEKQIGFLFFFEAMQSVLGTNKQNQIKPFLLLFYPLEVAAAAVEEFSSII